MDRGCFESDHVVPRCGAGGGVGAGFEFFSLAGWVEGAEGGTHAGGISEGTRCSNEFAFVATRWGVSAGGREGHFLFFIPKKGGVMQMSTAFFFFFF